MECYSTIKNKLLIHVTTYMSLKNMPVKETKPTGLHLHEVLEQMTEIRALVASGSGEVTERYKGTF